MNPIATRSRTNTFTRSNAAASTRKLTLSSPVSSSKRFASSKLFSKGFFWRTEFFSETERLSDSFYVNKSRQYYPSDKFSATLMFPVTSHLREVTIESNSIATSFFLSTERSESSLTSEISSFTGMETQSQKYSESEYLCHSDSFGMTQKLSETSFFSDELESRTTLSNTVLSENTVNDGSAFTNSYQQYLASQYFTDTGIFNETDIVPPNLEEGLGETTVAAISAGVTGLGVGGAIGGVAARKCDAKIKVQDADIPDEGISRDIRGGNVDENIENNDDFDDISESNEISEEDEDDEDDYDDEEKKDEENDHELDEKEMPKKAKDAKPLDSSALFSDAFRLD
jgi:hypothetical protein